MADIISGMSTAITLATRLREISKNIGDAEFKNILADLSLELADAKMKIADLISQNADLKGQLNSAVSTRSKLEEVERANVNMKEEIEALRRQLDQFGKPKDGLHEDAEKILHFIGQNESTTPSMIAKVLKISRGVMEMHLDDLIEASHLDASYCIGQEPEYYLRQDGRRYLHARGLL